MKLAANLSMLFTEVPFLDRFGAAKAAGFDAVEFLFPYAWEPEDIAGRLAEHGLRLVLHNLPPGDWEAGERGMACDPRRIGEFQAGIALGLRYAVALGVPNVHCMAGLRPAGIAPELARSTYIANLRYAAGQFAAHGIGVLVEPINHFDMPGYFLTGSRQALDLLDECARPNLGLQYDIYHMQRMEGELANTLRAHLGRIRHIQIADTPGRHEPGTGEINYPYLFRLLGELGYDGWIGCEYRPLTTTAASLSWLPR